MKHRDEIGLADKRHWRDQGDHINLAAKYKAHVLEVKSWIDACLRRLHERYKGFPLMQADCSNIIDAAMFMVESNYSVANAMKGGGRILYEESVKTCFDLYEELYLLHHDHVVAYGGTNLGKTSCSHFLRFITGPLNYIVRDVFTCVINVYIPRRTVIEQAEASFNSLIDLYGLFHIRLVDGSDSVGLKQYHDHVTKKLWPHAVEGKRKNDTNQSRTKEEIRKISKRAAEEGFALLTMVDEVHYAPKESGYLGNKMDAIDPVYDDEESKPDAESDEYGIGAQTLEDVRNVARTVCAFSATPDTNLVGPWNLVRMHYSPIYAGTHQYFLGFKIADRVIPVWGFSEFMQKSGIDLSSVDSRLLNSPQKRPGVRQVQRMYATVLEALKWCYQHRPNGTEDNGTFVRLERSNINAVKFADYIEKHSDIKVVRYFGIENKENIRDKLAGLIKEGRKFCVVPTGACRMADDLPREVATFFDLTYRTIHSTAVRQSTCGRAGGHGKHSLVILSDLNARSVAVDNMRLGIPVRAPSQHTSKVNGAARSTTRDSLLLDFNANWSDPKAQAEFTAIQRDLEDVFTPWLILGKQGTDTRIQLVVSQQHIADRQARDTPKVKVNERTIYFPLLDIFSEARMRRLTSFFGQQVFGEIELLREHHRPDTDPKRLATFDGYVAVSVGTAGRGGKTGNAALGGSDYEKRNKTARQSFSKYANGRRPELLFEYDSGVFRLHNISLPLVHDAIFVVDDTSAVGIIPKDDTWQSKLNNKYAEGAGDEADGME